MALIYYADDEQEIREIVSAFLKNDGYQVRAFETGDLLLEAFHREPCDLVLLDLMMPGTGDPPAQPYYSSLCYGKRRTAEGSSYENSELPSVCQDMASSSERAKRRNPHARQPLFGKKEPGFVKANFGI